jgi:hypothetical protein
MCSPCFTCSESDRFVGCHGMCKKYIDWQAENELKKQRKNDFYNKNGILVESYARHSKRNRNPNRTYKGSLR